MSHADVDKADLQDAIQKLLRDRVGVVEIVSVSIDDSAVWDDGVIEIFVMFEGSRDELVEGQPSGLYAMVRDTIADFYFREAPSPVFHFISADALV